KLARKVKVISQRLKGTTVHHTSFSPYEGEVSRRKRSSLSKENKSKEKKRQEAQQHHQDDKFSDLTPENYLVWRVEDQFKWYRKRTRKLDIQLHGYQWGVYILGGVGSFLVALDQDTSVAVTTALAAAFSSFLELKRVETTLIAYNQAADDLYDISTWWHGLSDQEKLEKFELLVISTERTIQSENVGWVQEMNDALAELYGETEESEAKGTNPSPSQKVDTK
ncbi:MAG: SLATT domain-containing protein, partial [Moorea sp. SIO3C2]|nr:SLATT domain-containing protein [Moorena sp. SIO3C2]